MGRPVVVMFVREPEPGRSKTRLASGCTPVQAANLYRIMVEVLRDRLLPHAGCEYDLWIYATPAKAASRIGAWLLGGSRREGTRVLAQPDGDLTGRLENAGERATQAEADAIVFIGSDCLELTHEDIVEALARLDGADSSIGRATDGGFWILAIRRWMPRLFHNVEYSSRYTCGQMLAQLRRFGMPAVRLDERTDIDKFEDLAQQSDHIKAELRRRAAEAGLDIPSIP
ncbi:TIGR04282 family arsenosugar biosynthesis glycosyltransferase [bacterium]|nr:TIGR04282 family arsenosugar biosynthesis glycosyltransferase [bacterium]